jgi:HD superfamily phosphohydrolase
MELYDPLYGRISVPPPFDNIVNSPHFRRLQHLRQLGLSYLSFSGGNHTRFEHCVGAFRLAQAVATALNRSQVGRAVDRQRLGTLSSVAALCHDVGHGPFSHMTENVLEGLGAAITHEDVGAALIRGPLANAISGFATTGVTPDLVASVITHKPSDDSVQACAETLVSSDLDLDRIDYLQRDSHYSGVGDLPRSVFSELEEAWELQSFGATYTLELTPAGVAFAERILFLRRSNYQRIVFESRHMAATAMFEKAVSSAAASSTEFGNRVSVLLSAKPTDDPAKLLEAAWPIYGMVDFEALRAIYDASQEARYLIQMVRAAKLFESVARISWAGMHYRAKQQMLGLRTVRAAFLFRRRLEEQLAQIANSKGSEVAVQMAVFRPPKPLIIGVRGGSALGDISELSRFLQADYLNHYSVEVFVHPRLESSAREAIAERAKSLFRSGMLFEEA